MEHKVTFTRRQFLVSSTGAAALGGLAAVPFAGAAIAQSTGATVAAPGAAASAGPAGYIFFGPDEVVFVEALVDVMCPADDLTPSGTECGIATYIDRQLAGGYGHGERLYTEGPWMHAPPQMGYQLPLSRAEWFKAGIRATQALCQSLHKKAFDELTPAEQDALLAAIGAGKHDDTGFELGMWFNDLVYPLFTQGCFADPIYGGNRDKVFWKMVGYPGLPATHGGDVITFKGKPYPGAADPKSIQDFS